MDKSGGQTVATVERAADMLQLFIESSTPDLGVTEIARSLDLSKAVVHRILTSLRARGFISLDESTRRYHLGTASLQLGLAALERLDVRRLARPAMKDLSARTDETATLSVRTGRLQRVYVEQVTPSREVKMSVRIGQPWPLHAGASSKAFLAFLPEDEIEEYLATSSLEKLTATTVSDRTALRREIAAIRERRYATSLGERLAGAASVATPIFDHTGIPVAVMSVCGPLDRFRAIADRATDLVLQAADSVSRQLGHQRLGP